MTPYYADDLVTLYHGEALNVLTSMPPMDIGAVIADPPYSSGGMFRSDRQADPVSKYSGWSPAGSVRVSAPAGSFAGDSRDQRGYFAWCSHRLGIAWSDA